MHRESLAVKVKSKLRESHQQELNPPKSLHTALALPEPRALKYSHKIPEQEELIS
jgi:hypothetical protein